MKNNKIENLRGFLALYVCLGHWIPNIFENKYLKFFLSFGQEAVIIFFVLSGMVINMSWQKSGNKSLYHYFIRRFRRIYFPFIVAIILSIIVVPNHFSIKELIGNLLMLQDFSTGKPGVFVAGFMGNTPLWSLSYEWYFYLAFPFVIPFLNKYRLTVIALLSSLSLVSYYLFPNKLFLLPAYFIIWWIGVEITRSKFDWNIVSTILKAYTIPLFTILAITFLEVLASNEQIQFGIYPVLLLRHFVFAVVFLVGLLLVRNNVLLNSILKPFGRIAPISYSLYIFHYIILVQWNLNLPIIWASIVKIIVLGICCYVTEVVLQPKVNKLIR